VDVTIDATGEYYSNLRTKAPPGSTKSQHDRAVREIDVWLEDTFGRSPICLKQAPPTAIHRIKANKQTSNAARRKRVATGKRKKR